MPALHHAVLDDQPHAALAGVVDDLGQDPVALAHVLADGLGGVTADERADVGDAERLRGVDRVLEVGPHRGTALRVLVQVVLVVRERGDLEAGAVEQVAGGQGVLVGERGDRQVRRLEVTAAGARPDGDLEPLVALLLGEPGDPVERPAGQAGGQHAELHRISRHVVSAALPITASMMSAERAPSAKVGSPSGATPVRTAV